MRRIVIYSAIFGDKDDPKQIPESEDYDHYIFTDNPKLCLDNCKIVVCPTVNEDPTRNAKEHKILSHEVLLKYEYSLWLDASISLTAKNVDTLFALYLSNHDIAVHQHPVRNCVYEEADTCIHTKKDNPGTIKQQMARYREDGYPETNGLCSAGIIFRRHTSAISKFNSAWWNEIATDSRRDQLSFNYVIWKLGFDYFTIKGHVRNNDVDGFSLHSHKKSDFINW